MEREIIRAKMNVPLEEQFEEVIHGVGANKDLCLVKLEGKWSSLEVETGITSSLWVDYHSPYETGWGDTGGGEVRGKSRAIVQEGDLCALVDEDDNVMGEWRKGTMKRFYLPYEGGYVGRVEENGHLSCFIDAWGFEIEDY